MLISIIIPIYNASQFLRTCLDSIAAQTYRQLELIFVNDYSQDDSIDILNSYIQTDKFAGMKVQIVHHDQNKGVAAARNTGLGTASGDYVYYIDADDYVEPNTLEVMYLEAKRTDADIIGIEWKLSFPEKERYMVQPNATYSKDAFSCMCSGVMRWNLWLFMVKRSLYEHHHLRFELGMNMGEDMMIMLKLALLANSCFIIHHPYYHYRANNASSISKEWSEHLIQQVTWNVEEVERFILQHQWNYTKEMNLLKLNIKLPLLISPRVADYRRWASWFPEANEAIFENKMISLRTRLLQYAASKHQFWLVKAYYYGITKFIYGFIYR